MPPFVRRKRTRTPEEEETVQPAKKRIKQTTTKAAAPTLFEAVDARPVNGKNLKDSRKILDQIAGEDNSSSGSEAGSDDFEDVPTTTAATNEQTNAEQEDEEDDWEDAIHTHAGVHTNHAEIGDVSISMKEDGSYVEPLVSAATGKKGPSKRERQIRMITHCLHVQALMWHNTVRNSWLNDSEVQKTLVSALPDNVKAEIHRWKKSMGMLSVEELQKEKEIAAKRSKKNKKGSKSDLKGRDWSYSADFQEAGNVDLSHGDPILRLLKTLLAYWKKRFTVTAPGLRKTGYMTLRNLREQVKGWEKDHSAEKYGERIENINAFRLLARECEGSRDVGAQLFVALLRGLGLEVRLIANLQPAGFGFSKVEDAGTKNKANDTDQQEAQVKLKKKLPPPKLKEALTPRQGKKAMQKEQSIRQSTRGVKSQPINLDDTDSELSSAISDVEKPISIDSDDASVMDVTPISKKRPTKKYDRDLPYPVYWAEVLSPVHHTWIPVDAVVMSTVANTDELLQSFEPRGTRADKGKQVICYTIAIDAKGTAKDVTIRYLKRHQLPGKTKGMRMPVEKVPIYNKRGKIKKYEEFDWFNELMLYYRKLDKDRKEADELEESTVLKPYKPAKEEKVVEKESLQWYKTSAEFVLEDHLRREEALLSSAQPVKKFSAGKGDKAKEYLVYRRDDVVACKTVESWHKEGRALLPGAQPLKYVPIRAVTLQRKREIEDAERETGEKLKQGLYSQAQTDWIIPPPIVDGVIPRNAFNNMDVFVPTMVPQGAVHLPLRGSAKICKRLEIDFAEACTGFEFGNKRAVPVLTGVVVAQENANLVRKAWKEDQAEMKRKEDVKRTAVALNYWRKMVVGLRVLDRMRVDYANSSNKEDTINPFVRKVTVTNHASHKTHDPATAGGFLTEADGAHDDDADGHLHEEKGDDDLGGGFLVDAEVDGDEVKVDTPVGPISLQSMHDAAKDKFKEESAFEDEPNTSKSILKTKKRSLAKSTGKGNPAKSRKLSERSAPKQAVRSTPKISPYFSSQEVVQSDDDSSELSEPPEEEVINVRQTTARTRKRAG